MVRLDWKKEFPRLNSQSFRPGDVFALDSALCILVERFNIYPDSSNPSWAWRVEMFPPSAHPPDMYSGDKYGLSEVNLYNCYKSHCVARGPERR